MAQVFKTSKDSAESVEILGVGRLEPGGQGGIPLERAALAMPELQEHDRFNVVVLDENGSPTPLTGSKLTAAAKVFAQERGLEIVNINDDKIASLREEAGHLPDLDAESLRQASIAEYQATYADLTPINTNPALANEGGVEALTDSIPEPSGKEEK